MSVRQVQAPSAVVMVRSHHFACNPDTARTNPYQTVDPAHTPDEIAARALAEFDGAVAALEAAGVTVHVFEDYSGNPNSVFPNNWFSTHHGGRIAIYPMFPPSRRRERRIDIMEFLKTAYRVQEIIDYSGLEADGLFLEGTGALVIDHVERVAYVGNSNRADPIVLERFCTAFGYEPMAFDTADENGVPVYHTNVILTIGTDFALICLAAIVDPARREEVRRRLADSGREVIDLTFAQVRDFAGNALELQGTDGPVLAMSERAVASLTPPQRETLERYVRLIPFHIPTIELEGGSARCMLAGIHLTRR